MSFLKAIARPGTSDESAARAEAGALAGDFASWLGQQQGRQYDLHTRYVNPAFVRMLRTIGFDKGYVRGEGPYLYDQEGKRYLDFLTGWGVFALGRNHPKVRAVLAQVLDENYPNLVRMDCSLLAGLVAERLVKHASAKGAEKLQRVFFCNSGTEAVEAAIKFARCATGKSKVLYCEHAFHGLTMGSLALNGADFFRERFGQMLPGTEAIAFDDLPALERALVAKDVAAMVIEPVQGKSCAAVSDGYLLAAQRLCRSAGALLVVDEVQCGLGRTGEWFAFQHWPGVEPDVVCIAKALSGGYVPVGAVITSARTMDSVFDSMERCVVHSNTFGQNDLAMAAALATLFVMEEDGIVENAAAMGEYAMSRLREIASTSPFVDEVRGKGLMFGIDFKRPERSVKLKIAWDTLHKLNFGVFSQMLVVPLLHDHQILTQVAGYHTELIKFLPPLTIGRADIDYFLQAMGEVLQSLEQVPGTAWNTMLDLAKGAMRA